MFNVVLVDDEQIILHGLSSVFPWERYGCRVVDTANDGRQGLAVIRQRKPDILFTDIKMPNMDGLAMVAALKSEFPDLQITVLTGFRDFSFAQKAINLGVCRYLLKPSKMEELHEAVSAMTQRLGAKPPGEETAEGESAAGSFVARAAVRYIEEHHIERLSLREVADQVYVSQWHLSKLINRYAGQSFFDLLNRSRIEHAKTLLADPARRINDIAGAVGFAEVAHFSRNFKKLIGKTPMEYRKSL